MGRCTLVTPFFWLQRASIIHDHPVRKSLQGALSVFGGQSFEDHNSELLEAIGETLNAIG